MLNVRIVQSSDFCGPRQYRAAEFVHRRHVFLDGTFDSFVTGCVVGFGWIRALRPDMSSNIFHVIHLFPPPETNQKPIESQLRCAYHRLSGSDFVIHARAGVGFQEGLPLFGACFKEDVSEV